MPSRLLLRNQGFAPSVARALLILCASACGGSAFPDLTAGVTDGDAGASTSSDAGGSDSPTPGSDPHNAGSLSDATLDAPLDAVTPPGDASPDAPFDPCASPRAIVAHCESLKNTSGIASSDVIACTDAMLSIRAPAALSCFSDAQRSAFDSTALSVLDAALSLTKATCDVPSLQTRLAWIEHYVKVARSVTGPTETIDHAKLNQIDAAYWEGVYSGDPRATAFNRSTLRTMRPDGMNCARNALDAALTPVGSPAALPLTTAPLVGIVSEAVSALDEGYARTTVAHEFACSFTTCPSNELPGASATWSALAALDDGAAFANALGPNGSTTAAWGASLARFAAAHASFELAVLDAVGGGTYSPAMLSTPSASDLPAFGALVAARDHARALNGAYASSGAYLVPSANDLHTYPAQANFEVAVQSDFSAHLNSVQKASDDAKSAQAAFQAGTKSSYDLMPFESSVQSVMQWTVAYVLPVIRLRLPATLSKLDQREHGQIDGPLLDLAACGDAPVQFNEVSPNALYSYADAAVGAVRDIVSSFRPETTDVTEHVAVTFPNPSYAPAAGDPPLPWSQADAARSKAIWDAVAAKSKATLTITPDDVYSKSGGASVVVCSQAGLVLRGLGLLVEYAPGATPPVGAGAAFALPFTASAAQPYLTSSAQIASLMTEIAWDHADDIPVDFVNQGSGWAAGDPLVAQQRASGASPFAPFTIDFAALSAAISKSNAEPRTLTVMMNVEVGALQEGSLSFVKGCAP